MRTFVEVEKALDEGRLGIVMSNGQVWIARRNGKTKFWKRDESRFRIPIKFGFKEYGAIDQDNIDSPEITIED